jgi:hypothetical protein
MEVGASNLGVAARVNLTFGGAMSDATLGDVGRTLGALGGFCGSGAGGIEGCGWGWVEAAEEECLLAKVWWYDSGNGAWFLPPTEEVAESGDCMVLGLASGGGSIGDGVGDDIKAVDNGVGWCDIRDGEVVMTEVNCVGDSEGLGFGIDDTMAEVMLK